MLIINWSGLVNTTRITIAKPPQNSLGPFFLSFYFQLANSCHPMLIKDLFINKRKYTGKFCMSLKSQSTVYIFSLLFTLSWLVFLGGEGGGGEKKINMFLSDLGTLQTNWKTFQKNSENLISSWLFIDIFSIDTDIFNARI